MSLQLWEVYFKRLLEACMEHVFKAPHKPPLQAWPRPASDVSLVAVVSVGAFKGPLYSRMRVRLSGPGHERRSFREGIRLPGTAAPQSL